MRELRRLWGELLLVFWATACWVWLLGKLAERYAVSR